MIASGFIFVIDHCFDVTAAPDLSAERFRKTLSDTNGISLPSSCAGVAGSSPSSSSCIGPAGFFIPLSAASEPQEF
jgi:hypothetical protein